MTKIEDDFMHDFIRLAVKVASVAQCHIEIPDKRS